MISKRVRAPVTVLVALVGVVALAGCRGEQQQRPVRSLLEGHVTVRAEVDTTRDYRDFEVLVASADGEADTLGFAITDSTGFFRMELTAPERGIYPLIVSRRGALLKQGQIVIAEADTASLRLRLPDGNRPLVIRSVENAAWLAYRNTKMVHNRELLSLIQSGEYSPEGQSTVFRQSAQALWSLFEQFPGTIGAEVASAESILMLEGIDDSVVVARIHSIRKDHTAFADAARAARRAQARLHGQDSSLALMRRLMEDVTDQDVRAALASEIVAANVDSNDLEAAVTEARTIIATYPETEWADWAQNAVYEMENLMPGMAAPSFEAVTWEGETYTFDATAPNVVLLEFFRPTDETFARERPLRDSLASGVARDVTVIAISVETDRDLNEAFFESSVASVNIALPAGLDDPIAQLFNVRVLPKRLLIKDGKIVGKYTGPAIEAVANDLLALQAERPS